MLQARFDWPESLKKAQHSKIENVAGSVSPARIPKESQIGQNP
jgi:hypothetical protein